MKGVRYKRVKWGFWQCCSGNQSCIKWGVNLTLWHIGGCCGDWWKKTWRCIAIIFILADYVLATHRMLVSPINFTVSFKFVLVFQTKVSFCRNILPSFKILHKYIINVFLVFSFWKLGKCFEQSRTHRWSGMGLQKSLILSTKHGRRPLQPVSIHPISISRFN